MAKHEAPGQWPLSTTTVGFLHGLVVLCLGVIGFSSIQGFALRSSVTCDFALA